MKIFSLKTKLDELFFIDEEVELFNEIDPTIIKNLKEIIKKINNKNITFSYIKGDYTNSSLISFTNNKFKNFYPIDYNSYSSNYNFFKDYFKFSDYTFNSDAFIKIHLYLNKYANLRKINRLIYYTPFFLERLINKKNTKNYIYKIIPKIRLKDKGFYKKFHFMGMYFCYYEKSKEIKQKLNYVYSYLNDISSKKDYLTLINGRIEECWSHYFSKAHNICQYSDYINLNSNSVIINCGVEDGVELKLFDGVNKIYNIDPGKDNYLDYSVKYILQKKNTKNIFLDYALYTNEGIYRDEDKNIQNISTLKEIIDKHKINRIDLIKSDIEGAERYMVNDLIEICNKFNSQLAISIYHTNKKRENNEKLYDLVDIPSRLIEKLKDKYNFFSKHYSYERWQSIFYAIPKNEYNEVRK